MTIAIEKIGPAPRFKVYATAADTDLVAEGGASCKFICPMTPGDLTVEDEFGNQVTLPAAGGPFYFVVKAKKILSSGSTAADILVGW